MFTSDVPSSVSIKVTATNAGEAKIKAKKQDQTIGRIFVAIMTGAASLMSALGFVVTGHPALLVSAVFFAFLTIVVLPQERSYHVRPYRPYSPYTPVVSSPPIIFQDSSPIIDYAPITRSRRSPPVQVNHYPQPPAFVTAPMEEQLRAPIGERVVDVYHDHTPSAPAMPFSMSASLPQDFQDHRIEGSGATARAKIGARR